MAVLGANGRIGVDILADDLAAHGRAQGQRRPTASRVGDASKAALVLKQKAYLSSCGKAVGYGFEDEREFF